MFLAKTFAELNQTSLYDFVVIYQDTILSNNQEIMSHERINKCVAEEADPRVIRRIIDQADSGIKTIDSDVIILAIGYCDKILELQMESFFC